MLLSQIKTKESVKKVTNEDTFLTVPKYEKPYTLAGMPAVRLTDDQYNNVMTKLEFHNVGNKAAGNDLVTNKEAIQMIYNVKPGNIINSRYYNITVGKSSFDRNSQSISVYEYK